MTPNLYETLKIRRVPIIANPPAAEIGGAVFVMEHGRFFSVNHISESGTGWQSERISQREEADVAAEVLADHLRARVI